MEKEVFDLYSTEKIDQSENTTITLYRPFVKTGNGAVIIFAGGGYLRRCEHEEEAYAQFIRSMGICAYTVAYRCEPYKFPLQLSDARSAVRFVRANANKFNIDGDKIAVMGSSAGGHLAALLSTYRGKVAGEELSEYKDVDYIPSAQILCYPVICSDESIGHVVSYKRLLGDNYSEREKFSPDLIADNKTPKAFIWHTFEDEGVNVMNSYKYAEKLKKEQVPTELHIFPEGQHGISLANGVPHTAQWKILLENWLRHYKFI